MIYIHLSTEFWVYVRVGVLRDVTRFLKSAVFYTRIISRLPGVAPRGVYRISSTDSLLSLLGELADDLHDEDNPSFDVVHLSFVL